MPRSFRRSGRTGGWPSCWPRCLGCAESWLSAAGAANAAAHASAVILRTCGMAFNVPRNLQCSGESCAAYASVSPGAVVCLLDPPQQFLVHFLGVGNFQLLLTAGAAVAFFPGFGGGGGENT